LGPGRAVVPTAPVGVPPTEPCGATSKNSYDEVNEGNFYMKGGINETKEA
jgi:hypothetical protein